MYSFHKLVKLGKAKRIPQFCFILILWCFLSTTCVVFGSIAHRARPTRGASSGTTSEKAYDQSVRAFSPSGAIKQIEYAMKAAAKGSLAVALECSNGVVVGVVSKHKKSLLLVRPSIEKISIIDGHILAAVSGILPDGKMIVSQARKLSMDHWFVHDEPVSLEGLASELSWTFLKFHGYTQEEKVDNDDHDEIQLSRPFGVDVLLLGYDSRGLALWHIDPSGAYIRWKSKAIGMDSEVAESHLSKFDFKNGTCDDGVVAIREAIKKTLGDNFDPSEITFQMVLKPNNTEELSMDPALLSHCPVLHRKLY